MNREPIGCTTCGGNDHNADECKRFAGELLPCPCCGSDELDFAENKTEKHPSDYIACNSAIGCGLMIARCDTLDGDLAGAWNRRAAQPAPVVPEGWKLVPIKPTAEMVNGAWNEPEDGYANHIEKEWAGALKHAPEFAAASAQGQQVEFGDAYQGAREDLAIWKRRALEAEEKLRAQCDGQSFMGEPLVQPYEAPREKIEALFKQLGFSGQVSVGEILDAALSALKAQQVGQEPVAVKEQGAWDGLDSLEGLPNGTKLYTTPQPALKAQQVGQEPVAWMDENGDIEHNHKSWMGENWSPLYTAPQPAPAQDVARLVEALEAIVAEDYNAPHDATDSALSMNKGLCLGRIKQKARAALAAHDKQSGGADNGH